MDDEASNAYDKRFLNVCRFKLVSAFLFRIVGVTRRRVGRVEGKMLRTPSWR